MECWPVLSLDRGWDCGYIIGECLLEVAALSWTVYNTAVQHIAKCGGHLWSSWPRLKEYDNDTGLLALLGYWHYGGDWIIKNNSVRIWEGIIFSMATTNRWIYLRLLDNLVTHVDNFIARMWRIFNLKVSSPGRVSSREAMSCTNTDCHAVNTGVTTP